MKKRLQTAARVVGLIGLVGLSARYLVPAEDRNYAYALTVQTWYQTWPLGRGHYLPQRLGPVLRSLGFLEPIWQDIEPGVKMLLDPSDSIDRSVLLSGDFDGEVWKWIKSSVEVGATVIDVGAHKGLYTLRASRTVGPQGLVIAIEPNPTTAAWLRGNIEANKMSNIKVLEIACGQKPGVLQLHAGPSFNTGMASLSALRAKGTGEVYDVEVRPLDNVVEALGLERIDLIKIDTEGAETMIVRGSRKSLANFRPVLVLETVDGHLRDMGSSLQELEALLRDIGYHRRRIQDSNSEWVRVQ